MTHVQTCSSEEVGTGDGQGFNVELPLGSGDQTAISRCWRMPLES